MTALATSLREMRPSDENFVLSTWLRSFSRSGEVRHAYRNRQAQYFEDYEGVVKAIMARSVVAILCLEENRDVILGWMCTNKDTLHYVFVKPRFRECGFAGQLLKGLDSLPANYTHITEAARDRLRIPEQWQFRPFRRFQ